MVWWPGLGKVAAFGLVAAAASCTYTIDYVPPEESAPSAAASRCGSLQTLEHCGGCGVRCAPAHATSASCDTGACVYDACIGSYRDCDPSVANGCETDVTSDPLNCGGCGVFCQESSADHGVIYRCVEGVCESEVCRSDWGDCDEDATNGCEASLLTVDHCGSCTTPCRPLHVVGETCIDGTCRFAACEAPWGDCDADPFNGCETNLQGDSSHCGSCATGCGVDETCVEGQCDGPPPSVPTFANEMVFDGWVYASLDDVPLDAAYGDWTDDCQEQWLELPYGWQRAPIDDYNWDVVNTVIGGHEWGTSCMLLADGQSFGTMAYGSGWWCGCWTGECVEQAGDRYFRVTGCDRRLLIRRLL